MSMNYYFSFNPTDRTERSIELFDVHDGERKFPLFRVRDEMIEDETFLFSDHPDFECAHGEGYGVAKRKHVKHMVKILKKMKKPNKSWRKEWQIEFAEEFLPFFKRAKNGEGTISIWYY